MRVCVTGANGFVGSRLCANLIANGHGVQKLPRSRAGYVSVNDIDAISNSNSSTEACEVVVHLAARVHVMKDESSDPLSEFRRSNVNGTVQLARQAAQAGVRRFVFISSVKVNGEFTQPELPFTPVDSPAPQDDYGQSKHEAEQALWQVARETGMEVVIIRPPLVYGPGVKGNFARMVKWVRQGVPLPLGAVQNRRSLVALDNLVDFIVLCASPKRSPQAANQTFLVSDGDDVSTTELLRSIASAYGAPARLFSVPAPWLRMAARLAGKSDMAERLLGSLQIDASKARGLLNWTPPVSMYEQLKTMVEHDSGL
jgi:nucleoside-diphosphate-sugar epimerase